MSHASSSSTASEAPEPPEAKDYFWSAWDLVRRDPFVVLWQLGLDLVRWLLYPIGLLWVTALIASQWTMLREAGVPGGEIMAQTLRDLGSPMFLLAFVMLMGTLALVGWALEIAVMSGIWHTLSEGVRGTSVRWLVTYLEGIPRGFPQVAVLYVLKGVARWTMYLVGAGLGIGLFVGFRHSFGVESPLLQAGALALPIFMYMVLAILVRLTFEVASAPMFVEGRRATDALRVAATWTVRRFGALYRLLVFALGLWLIPLVVYWLVLMLQSAVSAIPAGALAMGIVRLGAEIGLALSTSLISILFYGALFLYYARAVGALETLPRRWTTRAPSASEEASTSINSTEAEDDLEGETSTRASEARGRASNYEGGERLRDLLPLEHDHVVSLREIPGLEFETSRSEGSPSASPETTQSSGTEGDERDDSSRSDDTASDASSARESSPDANDESSTDPESSEPSSTSSPERSSD